MSADDVVEVEPEPVVTLSTMELARALRVSYRRIDYWTRRGFIEPIGEPTPGTGSVRHYAADAVHRAALLTRLARVGILPEVGARTLDELLDPTVPGDDGIAVLGPGVLLVVESP